MRKSKSAARRRWWAHLGCASLLVSVTAAGAVSVATPAWAQSPTPDARMWDMAPGGTWPGTDATLVEGLGMGNCDYSVSSVEDATVTELNAGRNTVTEISPQSACASISTYKTYFSDIEAYVEDHASNASGKWGGIMLDEETGWGFTAANYETLNSDVASVMGNTPGLSWYYTENAPEQWSVSTYNALVGDSYAAPQIYNTDDVDNANAACSDDDDCINMVTIDDEFAAPWDEVSYVTGLIDGTPYQPGWDDNAFFSNIWVPV
jgi:hypothetical protein